ncbi:MAG TPA: uracil phosphoribosyltransferase [Bacteroidetes bacterium]|nr:uracil phosphoribosyltransferase [Bacteroidota bacterium]
MDKRLTLIGKENSIFSQFIYEMRAVDKQGDRLRFRKNIFRCAQIMAYELSKQLDYTPQEVITPLGALQMDLVAQAPVLVSILRAGVPMHNGFLDFFDGADNGFISAYRHHTKGNEFIVKVEYLAMPNIEGRTLVLLDPMIASGKSIVLSYQAMVPAQGTPEKVFICGLIASEEGIEYVQRHIPNAHIMVGAMDSELTAKAYIVPGLGDAGDLAFGEKSSG